MDKGSLINSHCMISWRSKPQQKKENKLVNRVLDNMDKCYGCGSCVNKCSKGAITMEPNANGFLYPVIDNEKCVDCKLCQKVCPALSAEYDNDDKPVAYAFAAGEEILQNSSSGGGFTVVAEEIFKHNGHVVGVAYDDKFNTYSL